MVFIESSNFTRSIGAYLFIPEQAWIFLLDIYGKDEKDDLTSEEKKVLARLATRFKETAKGPKEGW